MTTIAKRPAAQHSYLRIQGPTTIQNRIRSDQPPPEVKEGTQKPIKKNVLRPVFSSKTEVGHFMRSVNPRLAQDGNSPKGTTNAKYRMCV